MSHMVYSDYSSFLENFSVSIRVNNCLFKKKTSFLHFHYAFFPYSSVFLNFPPISLKTSNILSVSSSCKQLFQNLLVCFNLQQLLSRPAGQLSLFHLHSLHPGMSFHFFGIEPLFPESHVIFFLKLTSSFLVKYLFQQPPEKGCRAFIILVFGFCFCFQKSVSENSFDSCYIK